MQGLKSAILRYWRHAGVTVAFVVVAPSQISAQVGSTTRVVSNWTTSTAKDEMTDAVRLVVRTVATAPVRLGAEPEKPALLVRCENGKLDIYITTTKVLNDREVEVRFDDEPSTHWPASRSESFTALFLHETSLFVKWLRDATKLRVRLSPYAEVSAVVTFNVAGFLAHLPALEANGCKSDPQPVARDQASEGLVLEFPGLVHVEEDDASLVVGE